MANNPTQNGTGIEQQDVVNVNTRMSPTKDILTTSKRVFQSVVDILKATRMISLFGKNITSEDSVHYSDHCKLLQELVEKSSEEVLQCLQSHLNDNAGDEHASSIAFCIMTFEQHCLQKLVELMSMIIGSNSQSDKHGEILLQKNEKNSQSDKHSEILLQKNEKQPNLNTSLIHTLDNFLAELSSKFPFTNSTNQVARAHGAVDQNSNPASGETSQELSVNHKVKTKDVLTKDVAVGPDETTATEDYDVPPDHLTDIICLLSKSSINAAMQVQAASLQQKLDRPKQYSLPTGEISHAQNTSHGAKIYGKGNLDERRTASSLNQQILSGKTQNRSSLPAIPQAPASRPPKEEMMAQTFVVPTSAPTVRGVQKQQVSDALHQTNTWPLWSGGGDATTHPPQVRKIDLDTYEGFADDLEFSQYVERMRTYNARQTHQQNTHQQNAKTNTQVTWSGEIPGVPHIAETATRGSSMIYGAESGSCSQESLTSDDWQHKPESFHSRSNSLKFNHEHEKLNTAGAAAAIGGHQPALPAQSHSMHNVLGDIWGPPQEVLQNFPDNSLMTYYQTPDRKTYSLPIFHRHSGSNP